LCHCIAVPAQEQPDARWDKGNWPTAREEVHQGRQDPQRQGDQASRTNRWHFGFLFAAPATRSIIVVVVPVSPTLSGRSVLDFLFIAAGRAPNDRPITVVVVTTRLATRFGSFIVVIIRRSATARTIIIVLFAWHGRAGAVS
jgi:hypothetical protein